MHPPKLGFTALIITAPYMHPEAGSVVELLGAILAPEAPLFGVEGVGVDLEVRLEGEAPRAEAALVPLGAPDCL